MKKKKITYAYKDRASILLAADRRRLVQLQRLGRRLCEELRQHVSCLE